jgi:thioester reductase-like protein
MAVFVTGATGYLGSYVAAGLLAREQSLSVLVRADSRAAAEEKLWRALQLHMDASTFTKHLARVRIFGGDLARADLGLSPEERRALVESTDSVVHAAAALNRQSERACMNVNVRGTLAILKLARAAHEHHGLRRFTHVSTVSVAGVRAHEIVREDEAIDWDRRDFDPYGRTKKLAEHLVRELLPDVPVIIVRPSTVLGDSRKPATTQFDLVRAFSFLASVPMLPLRPLDRLDVVPADWVGDAIVEIHERAAVRHDTYHLSAGRGAPTFHAITEKLSSVLGRRSPSYVPGLAHPISALLNALGHWAPAEIRHDARLLRVFWPYLLWDTVFENSRAVAEMGRAPVPFPSYCVALLDFARSNGFRYPYRERPPRGASSAAPARVPTVLTGSPRSGNGGNGGSRPAEKTS